MHLLLYPFNDPDHGTKPPHLLQFPNRSQNIQRHKYNLQSSNAGSSNYLHSVPEFLTTALHEWNQDMVEDLLLRCTLVAGAENNWEIEVSMNESWLRLNFFWEGARRTKGIEGSRDLILGARRPLDD